MPSFKLVRAYAFILIFYVFQLRLIASVFNVVKNRGEGLHLIISAQHDVRIFLSAILIRFVKVALLDWYQITCVLTNDQWELF